MHLKQPGPSAAPSRPYLGFFVCDNGTPDAGTPLAYPGPKHLLSFGTPGANKSMGLVVPNLMLLRRSMIVIDPKGQLAAITHRARSAFGRCIVINPFGELVDVRPELQSDGWNPMRQLRPHVRGFESKARSIAEAIADRQSGSKGDFFEASNENLWTTFTMRESRVEGDRATLRNVRALIASGTDSLLSACREMMDNGDYAESVAAARIVDRLTDKTSHSTSMQDTIDTVMKNTSFLNDDDIHADMVTGGAIDFPAMHQDITTVYVILPVGQLRKQAKWLRMFFKLAFAELFENAPRKAALPPVMMFLDEFGNLGHLPEVLEAMNIARDYRVQLWMFLQHIQQLEAVYPKNISAFFAGSGAITTFDCRDWATAEHFSKLFGKREVEMSSQTTNRGFNVRSMSFTDSRSTQVFPLIQPEDLWRMGRARTMSFIDPCPFPIAGLAPGYWDCIDPASVDPNPYYHGGE
ncbi:MULTISPECIES: type IV secretory system conjugative DNA transfer family protein [unclassified Methylobacterium]|uniref:type IV secretory system conjugative DNA transfer family protein n=1 Tax=unclassified Methylobacterium TaxID=2615210 RepID=UPI0022699DEC|nr:MULTISPECIES: type IV secretory system conjugative DNA transfer family protein [unclassified Methylobacterium]